MAAGRSCWELALDHGQSDVVIAAKRRERDRRYQSYLATKDITIDGVPETLHALCQQYRKERAVEALLTPMGRTLSHALVFGDDVPDLGMLQAAGVAVAMANACPEVKAMARYRTEHHNVDGVATFLEPWLERWGMPPTGTRLERDHYA
jgi:hydroxymethylpyrimidine pyrophosphatase-like HAD family hydrolase